MQQAGGPRACSTAGILPPQTAGLDRLRRCGIGSACRLPAVPDPQPARRTSRGWWSWSPTRPGRHPPVPRCSDVDHRARRRRPPIWVTANGVKLSTSVIGVTLVAQVAVMLAVCVAALVGHRRRCRRCRSQLHHGHDRDPGRLPPDQSVPARVHVAACHRSMFSPVHHVAVPVLGSAVLVVPFIELCEPGQPSPYGTFPFIALALVAVAAAIRLAHRAPPPRTGSS
jgi:hypothetical protein